MDLNNDTITTADAEADVNKQLPSSIRFKFNAGGNSATFTPAKPLPRSVQKIINRRIRELNNIQYEKGTDGSGGLNKKLLDNIETLKSVYKVARGIHFNYKQAERAAEKAAKKEAAKAERERVKTQARIASDQPEQSRVKARTNKIKADKIIAETATNSDQLGKETAGFKSLTESTKPKTAIPKPNKVQKPNPSPSEMTANVPGITVTKEPSDKSSVDILGASVTEQRKNLNKLIASGSSKGVKQTLENSTIAKEYNIRAPDVNNAVKSNATLQDLATDPFIQNGLKGAGLSADEIEEVNKEIDEAIVVAASQEQKLLAVQPQKDFSVKQFRALGNPFGSPEVSLPTQVGQSNPLSSLVAPITKNPLSSLGAIAGAVAGAKNSGALGAVVGGVIGSVIGDAINTNVNGANNFAPGNPFGSLGMDFGNIMATVTGLAQGTGSFKELGQSVPSIPGGVDALTKAPVPDIVQSTGTTQLAKTVDKGTKTAVDTPTTPVKQVTKTKTTGFEALGYDEIDGEFFGGYEPVNSKKEFELELKSCPRKIKNAIIVWTATAENEFYTARSYNEKRHKQYKRKPEEKRVPTGTPVGRIGYQRSNYFIRKDGVVERLIPIGTRPTYYGANKLEQESKSKYKKIHDEGIMIQFDAGILGDAPDAGLNHANLSDKSITAEQWKSFDMMMDVMYRHSPGGVLKGLDQILAESKGIIKRDGTEVEQLMRFQDIMALVGPGFDVGEYLEKKREVPDGEDGITVEIVVDDDTGETVEDDDPYAGLDDDFLNSEVINGNKVEYDDVRGRWQVIFRTQQLRLQYGSKDEAIAAARENNPQE